MTMLGSILPLSFVWDNVGNYIFGLSPYFLHLRSAWGDVAWIAILRLFVDIHHCLCIQRG